MSHDRLFPMYGRYDENTPKITLSEGAMICMNNRWLLDWSGAYGSVIMGHRRILFQERDACPLFGQTHPGARQLAERLCQRTGYHKVLFGTSGTDVMDAALRIALALHESDGPARFLVRENGFHGTSQLTLACSGFPSRARMGIETTQVTHEMCDIGRGVDPEQLLGMRISDWRFGAFVFEPVLGVGGGHVLEPLMYKAIARRVRENGGLVIADEVLTGCGRTGSFLASSVYETKPDIVCIGKGLTNGAFPLSALLISKEAFQRLETTLEGRPERFTFGSTYAGHPTGCEVALKVLKMVTDNLLDNVTTLGEVFESVLVRLRDEVRLIGSFQGQGLLWGISCSSYNQARRLQQLCREQRLEVVCEGKEIVLLPMLNSSPDLLAMGSGHLESALQELSREE